MELVTALPETSSELNVWDTEQTLKELLTTEKTSFSPSQNYFVRADHPMKRRTLKTEGFIPTVTRHV